jgi:isocitrate dehydrogenase
LVHRDRFDSTPDVVTCAETPEKVRVGTVASALTRDPAILISTDQPWMDTEAVLGKRHENLKKAMA